MSENLLGADLKLVGDEAGSDLALSPSGDLDLVKDEFNLGQALINRLRTRRGELADLGHPNYGSRLHELVGEPNNERTRELAKAYVRESIGQDPRVEEIISIVVKPHRDDYRRLDIDITVKPIGKSTVLNIVFPFYLEVV